MKASGLKVCGSAAGCTVSVQPSALIDDITLINMSGNGAVTSGQGSSRGGHSVERVYVKSATNLLSSAVQFSDLVIGKLEYAMVAVIRPTVTDTGTISIERFAGTDGDSRTWGPYHEISRVTDVVDGSANNSMKVVIVSTTGATVAAPMRRLMAIYKHTSAFTAGQTVTVTLRMRRSHATNIIPWLMVRGGSVVATDQKTAMTAAANTWETVTVSFTSLASSEELYLWWECSASSATDFFHINMESLNVTVA